MNGFRQWGDGGQVEEIVGDERDTALSGDSQHERLLMRRNMPPLLPALDGGGVAVP